MNPSILNTDIQEFINKHLNANVSKLLLKGIGFDTVETKEIIEQLEAKKRCEKKLPTWFNTEKIYYPNKLNIEQTSSEITANYKSNLISGESITDLTGGFGVDCLYFSKHFKAVEYCEINETLSEIVKYNFAQLHIQNISTHNIDGFTHLKSSNKQYDWIYLDPSRRHDSKGKVFLLNDCLPNIPEHIDLLFKCSKNIMIKTSPLLDFSVGINELTGVKTIHVVAINNEVKELLWILEKGFNSTVRIKTINIKKEKTAYFNFFLDEEKHAQSRYNQPLTYLYEPNAAILKAGGFHSVSNQFNVFKLHQHSHLYTSDVLLNFPGRRFKIEKVLAFSKKKLKKETITKANITTRNFPETVQQIRKKFNIKDGGSLYLFFTTDINDNKMVIITRKLNE